MAVNVEQLGALERRMSMSVPVQDVDRQVDDRLKKLARNVKMAGFRPGKVPLKIVVQQYGPQVRSEVIGDAVQKAFTDAVKEANLKVAGQPRFEKKDGAADAARFEFSATFEVYPEVKVGDVSGKSIERPQVAVDDAAVERTLQILRKQRVTYAAAAPRAAQNGDRITVDFEGRIGGEPFAGGKAAGHAFVLGEKRMLPEFEAAALGLKAGDSKSFDIGFPEDYHGKDVAGKTATFEIAVKLVEEPKLPELDAEFAKQLGVPDGDLAKMRAEVRANVEREVKKRVETRLKSQALQLLLDAAPIELPKSLVQMETQHMVEQAAAELQAKGLKIEQLPFDPQAFETGARRRVALGLIINELARSEKLQPKPAEVRALIEAESQSYEHPAEVVKWFYMQPQRLSEMESLALESNVVQWVLSKAKSEDKPVAFDELMGATA
ncbi:MAG TPA: trigger factor [Burkholderiales bacterium]|nr:trigger factor [Burkholderiales bacterium]